MLIDGAGAPGVELPVKVHCCVLLSSCGTVAVIFVAGKPFNTPVAAACFNLLVKVHVRKIRVVDFVCFVYHVS